MLPLSKEIILYKVYEKNRRSVTYFGAIFFIRCGIEFFKFGISGVENLAFGISGDGMSTFGISGAENSTLGLSTFGISSMGISMGACKI